MHVKSSVHMKAVAYPALAATSALAAAVLCAGAAFAQPDEDEEAPQPQTATDTIAQLQSEGHSVIVRGNDQGTLRGVRRRQRDQGRGRVEHDDRRGQLHPGLPGLIMTEPRTQASTGELITELSQQTSRLVRDELRLAQKELQESAKHAGIGAGLAGAAGVLALLGLATLIAAAVAALSLVLPVWLSAVIVAVVLFVAAGIAALVGKKQAEQVPVPAAETVDSVKTDIDEIKGARHGSRT